MSSPDESQTTKKSRGRPTVSDEHKKDKRRIYNERYREKNRDYPNKYYHLHPDKFNLLIVCDVCGVSYRKNVTKKHLQSQKHVENIPKID